MDSLFKYFLFYLREKPGLFIHVHGSHTEYKPVHRRYKDSQGFTHTETHQEKHTVTDFDFRIDASNYVSKIGLKSLQPPKPRHQLLENGKQYLSNSRNPRICSKKSICRRKLCGTLLDLSSRFSLQSNEWLLTRHHHQIREIKRDYFGSFRFGVVENGR
ncbi:hypothetical protein BCR33DRAFT_50027 [Rhizoclosmatium globosum]|uniref:Uncharacterized protein n=1 Tax=Rhizoclosmatium globosum TaxID=329046 RepID=A0A1Y2AVZ7_9FUNG|nr:hypothetical protein BCR33DRAFT_50027 [Rhizoclosmatium globosum]|eukprot:ORY26407.1 hypothetical protein BCR33DRAFT_50027 [Rhizoclosmatium globosum]